jgi:hypothetical protein
MMHPFELPAGVGRFPFVQVAATVGTAVRPGRGRTRTKPELDEKIKKPADGSDGVRKKTPPARKAPARGRYVDEYARAVR